MLCDQYGGRELPRKRLENGGQSHEPVGGAADGDDARLRLFAVLRVTYVLALPGTPASATITFRATRRPPSWRHSAVTKSDRSQAPRVPAVSRQNLRRIRWVTSVGDLRTTPMASQVPRSGTRKSNGCLHRLEAIGAPTPHVWRCCRTRRATAGRTVASSHWRVRHGMPRWVGPDSCRLP